MSDVTISSEWKRLLDIAFYAYKPYSIIEKQVKRPIDITNIQIEVVPPPPPPEEYAIVTGRVSGLLGPIRGAEVTLNGRTTRTDPTGSFTFSKVKLDTYTLSIVPTSILDKILHSSISQTLAIYETKTYTLDIRLPINWLYIGALSTIPVGVVTLFALSRQEGW